MLIKVKNITNVICEYNVEIEDSILSLKDQIQEKEGIPTAQIKLLAKGKQLDDEKLFSEYKLEAGDTVNMVLSLRGGCM
jgi:hypothetical protein